MALLPADPPRNHCIFRTKTPFYGSNLAMEIRMLKTLLATAAALCAAGQALAQNDMAPSLGGLSDWEDAPPAAAGPLTFTTAGTYSDDGELRMIAVSSDADVNGDGAADKGVLQVTCNGGDMLRGVFTPGVAPAGKAVRASGSSPLAAGKTFKGSRPVPSGSTTAVTIDQPEVCEGLS